MSSAVNGFVHAVHKWLQRVPCAKSGTFRFAWTDSHDSPPICSAAVALQYETGTKFSI